MPELPEVEIMARNLSRWATGRRITRIELLDPALVKGDSDLSELQGRRVGAVWRRGKWVVMEVEEAGPLLLHFRMTGKVILDPDGTRKARLRLHTDDGTVVSFEDVRRFGEVWLNPMGSAEAFFEGRGLGPEPWPDERDGTWWRDRLTGLRGPIKPSLMRQDRVAGLGNIAASEVCFRAGIDPRTPVPSLTATDWSGVAVGCAEFIEHTLAEEGGDEIQYVNQGGEGSFSVYGHGGRPCLHCGSDIARIVQAGRATFFCPACQPSR